MQYRIHVTKQVITGVPSGNTNLPLNGYVAYGGENYADTMEDAGRFSEDEAQRVAKEWEEIGWTTDILSVK